MEARRIDQNRHKTRFREKMVIPNDGVDHKYIHFLQVYKNKTFAAKNNKKVAFALHCIHA